MSNYKGGKMPDVKMVLAEEDCFWENEGLCGVNAPDSICECFGKCSMYKKKN